ncbi:MAG: phosphatase PAP2 family protein [Chthoniobacterales bacterium]|nr:phosphatase PAP2 family protein [Chthoniobacterales bacterium]
MARALPWILAVLCGFLVWGAFRSDAPVREALVAAQGKKWKKSAGYQFHSAVRKYGDWPPLMGVCVVALAGARLLKSRRGMRILAAAMIASTLAGLVANASRLTTGRTRPRESPKIVQGFYGLRHEGKWLVGQSAYNSFPSGHTATAFGLAAVIFLASPAVGVFALAGAGLVAWSSIAMGAHHPSDVMVSVILSFLVAWFVWRWMRGRGGDWIERLLRLPAAEDFQGVGRHPSDNPDPRA